MGQGQEGQESKPGEGQPGEQASAGKAEEKGQPQPGKGKTGEKGEKAGEGKGRTNFSRGWFGREPRRRLNSASRAPDRKKVRPARKGKKVRVKKPEKVKEKRARKASLKVSSRGAPPAGSG